MSESAIDRLEALARADPTVALLALLQAEALRAAADKTWFRAVPAFAPAPAAGGAPLLHEQTLSVDPHSASRLLERLARAADQGGQRGGTALGRALRAKRLDALALVEASVAQAAEPLAALALEADLDPRMLTTIGQLVAWPVLLACGEAARSLLDAARWEAGYCPVCAAWPSLAELRGLDAVRWLRCGRCGAGWGYPHGRCAYCDNADYRTQGYLAPEAAREARRAVTCDACQGYLKTLTSFGPIPPDELALQDLSTLELDVAAIERGYGRPAAPGFALDVKVAGVAGRHSVWALWRR